MAEAYLDNPQNLPTVNHRDEDKTNNALPNLEYCTIAYNCNFGTRNQRLSKRVTCIETGEIFDSIKEAGKAKYIDPSCITRACKGNRKTAAGLHWRYYEQEN